MIVALIFYFTIKYLVSNGMGAVVWYAVNITMAVYLGVKIGDAIGWLGDYMNP